MKNIKSYLEHTQQQETTIYKPVYTADLEEYKDTDVDDDTHPDPNLEIVKDAKTKKVTNSVNP